MMAKPYITAAGDLRPNKEQWEAYESSGNCVILAGPGSGKTKTITVKIARILEEEIGPPQRLACITYSNECVGELRRRLSKLEVDDSGRLLISTVHSFALTELVLPFAQLAKVKTPDPLMVASPSEANKIFKEAYLKVIGRDAPRNFRTDLDRLRRQIPDKRSADWRNSNERQVAIIEMYEKLLMESGLIDFDGLVLVGLELVTRHAWVRSCIKAKYPVIVIDEYQDLGVALNKMVLALMLKAGVRIVAVGDPDQSVYGFTGARPILLKSLAKRKEVQAIQLRLNYRCANEIIDASKALLPDGSDSESFDGRSGSILIHGTGDYIAGQARYALDKLVPEMLKVNPEWKPGDIAFLYRSYNEGSAIAEVADSLGREYFRADNGSPIKRSRMTIWLTEMAQWCSGGWQTGEVSLSQILKHWRQLRQSLPEGQKSLVARAGLIKVLFDNRDGKIALRVWLLELYEAAIEEMFKEEPGLTDEEEAFDDLLNLTKARKLLADFTVEVFGNRGRSPDRMNLMTLHGSKGLEFQGVVMLGLEAGEFPSRYAVTTEDLEEAGRLFYVGVTRAKSAVHLLYNSNESPLITAIREAAL